jgi:membrane-associated protease RseP (regulator of RpoE activity)
MTMALSINESQACKSLNWYYWLAFILIGMGVGFAGCLTFSYVTKGGQGLLSDIAGNPKADKPIVQAALPVDEAVSLSVFLGVEIMSVDADIAEQFGLPKACGVLVKNVIDNSPADKAGLQRSDVILSVNNIAVENVDGFREIMAQLNPGDNVRIIYIRSGQKYTTYATLANLSAAAAIVEKGNDMDWGVSLSVLSSNLRTSLRIPADIDGIVILSVMPGGLADEAGLQEGDVITGINNTPIASMSDFFDAITAGDDNIALLDIYSKGQLRYIALDSSAVAAVAQQRQKSLLDRIISIFTNDDNIILTEHINEEDDYEKPVCKRLEESGERYDQ